MQLASKPVAAPAKTIILNNDQIQTISTALGGRLIRNAEDIVDAVCALTRVSLGGNPIVLAPEDMEALKNMYASFPHLTYPQYVERSIQDAVALFLTGSTRGLLY